jgi:hypothetical protein
VFLLLGGHVLQLCSGTLQALKDQDRMAAQAKNIGPCGRPNPVLRGERWLEAGQALQRAEGRLAASGPADLQAAVHRLRDDVTMVAKLEQIRLEKAVVKDGHFRIVGADRAYETAFEQHELPLLDLDPEEAARRIRNSIIRMQLVTALDDWAFIRQVTRASGAAHLFAIARLVDPDPWRQQLRHPVGARRACTGEQRRLGGVASISAASAGTSPRGRLGQIASSCSAPRATKRGRLGEVARGCSTACVAEGSGLREIAGARPASPARADAVPWDGLAR